MLVLTRKREESIIIGDKLVVIKILDIGRHAIRLGITAPKDLSVHREEIYDKINANDNLGNK